MQLYYSALNKFFGIYLRKLFAIYMDISLTASVKCFDLKDFSILKNKF